MSRDALTLLREVRDFLLTRIFYPNARLVRQPMYCKGKRRIVYGKGFTTGHGCRIEAGNSGAILTIGDDARIGDYVHIDCSDSITIGHRILVASKVFISDSSHGKYSGCNQSSASSNPNERTLETAPVYIGDDVWIGENVVILPGSSIGDGVVIGANSVVVGQQIDAGSIVVGAPARIIKRFDIDSRTWISVPPEK